MPSKLVLLLRSITVCALSMLAAQAMAQTTINVGPGQPYTTIQSGINAAANGDTVLVAPGTYYENIDFKGKAITVTSSGGAAATIIDGGGTAPAVLFITNENRASVLSGFTIQHGGILNYFTFVNGGIYLSGSSPTILNNTLTENNCWTIYSYGSAPLIQGNEINSTHDPKGNCSFGGGAGIYVSGNLNWSSVTNNRTTPSIIGNTIENNVESGLEDAGGNGGAGIAVWGGSPIIMNNLIRNNATQGSGGAINVEDGTAVAIVQNVIYGNSAACGGGALAYWGGSDPRTGITVLIANNTIANDTGVSTEGYSECTSISQIYPAPESYGAGNSSEILSNNIVSGSTTYPAVNCEWSAVPSTANQSLFEYDILYNSGGPFFGSYCVDVSSQDNNIATDPRFNNASAGDFHLTASSPGVDSGDNSVLTTFQNLTGLSLTTDFDGKPRVQDAGGKGCVIDMGAYEYPGSASQCGTQETLTSSLNPAPAGQSVTFTAQLNSASGTPTGSVQFLDGTSVLGTQTVSGTGSAAFNTSSLAVGSHAITANYKPTGVFDSSTASLTEAITGYSTSTSLTCQPNTIPIGGTALLGATVTSANGTPTGSIAFTDGGAALGNEALVNGAASLAYTGTVATTHTITATYTPTGSFAGSSASCTEVVNPLPTTSALTVAPATVTYGSPVSLTATVAAVPPPGPSTPTGMVTFYNSSSVLGTGTLAGGIATLSASNLPGGTYTLTCTYSGSSIYGASNCNSIPVTVNAAPSRLLLSSSANPANALSPVVFFVSLIVGGQSVGVGNAISLTINGQTVNLVTDATGSATYTISTLTPGSYPVTASFAGTSSLLASMATLTQVVDALGDTMVFSVAPNPAYVGQTVTLKAIMSVLGTSTPITAGSITFFDGSTTLGTVALSATGTATYTTSTLSVGTHPITASFVPSNTVLLASTSPVLNEVILASGFTIAVSPSTITLAQGASGSVAIQLGSVGSFAGPLTLSYGPLPQYATASISPAMVTLASGGSGTSTLTLNTLLSASNVVPARPGTRELPTVLAAVLLFFIPLGLARRNKMGRVVGLALCAVALGAMTGCTNAWHTENSVAAGTYQVAVTATDVNHNSQTATLTVVVTP